MPAPKAINMPGRSWAEAMEDDEHGQLPPIAEVVSGNTKVVTEFRIEDGKKVRITRTYKLEKRNVSKTVATRKNWAKFGGCSNDKPGPDPATTNVGDDIYMQFLSSKDEEKVNEQDQLTKLKTSAASAVKCRYCGLEHFSTKCPYKHKLENLVDNPADEGPSDMSRSAGMAGTVGGKYVPPSQRAGGNLKGESMARSKDESNTVRVTNLPDDVQDSDLKDLFAPVVQPARVTRIFLAKDKYTGQSKGFAFVSFDTKEAAIKAIRSINGYGYANLILNVELAKPSNN